MESTGRGSALSDDPPPAKKAKMIKGPESEAERDKLLIEKQKKRIYEQTMEIGELREKLEENVNKFDANPEMEEKEAALRAEIDELQKRIKDEKTDHENSLAEIKTTLNDKIGKLENDIIEKDAKIKDLDEQLCSKVTIKPDPDDDKNHLQKKIEELELSNNGLNTQLRRSEIERKELQVQCNKFQSFNDKSAKKIKELETNEAGLRSEVAELQERIDDEKTGHEKLLAEMKLTLRDQISKLENDFIEKDSKIKDLEEQLSAIIQIKSEPDDDKKLLQDKIDELELSNNGLKTQLQKRETEREDLQVHCNELAKRIKGLEAELQAKANLHQTKLSAVEEHHQKLSSEKFNKEIETRNKTIQELKENISNLEKCQEVLHKNMIDKQNSFQKLVAKHEQELKDLKEKFENEARNAKSEMDKLKTNVENLTEKISEDQKAATKFQNEVQDLKKKITVAKENEEKLQVEIEELKQKLREASSTSNDHQHGQANDLPRFVSLDEVRDGYEIKCNQFWGTKNVVVKVAKLVFGSDQICKLYSTLDPKEESAGFDLHSETPCQFQINSELKIGSNNIDLLISRIHSSNLTKLDLSCCDIYYDYFKKIVSSHTIKTFTCGNIVNPKTLGILGLDEIMKEVPNVEICEIRYFGSSDGCQKLVELPVFQNLKKFTIISSFRCSFDINGFVGFIKKHPNVEFFFKLNLLTEEKINDMPEKEKQFRELLPSTCKVVIRY